ncbi:hypothetical protein VTL71DRAFT_5463 [Oculimacula yallundae]|uniref:Uncharacterized protein n=1 Tax=Oculimacula yallundae TaxID=86028 RepID=A0ABR4C150_9HELO
MSSKEGYSVVVSKRAVQYKKKHTPLQFLKLPREIRDMIYKHCFVRPVGIAPGLNYGRRKIPIKERVSVGAWEKFSKYKCHWDGRRQFLPIGNYDSMTPVDGQLERMLVHWTSIPTQAQQQIISMGARHLPHTQMHVSTKIDHVVNKRHDGSFEIINSQWQIVAGLTGIGLLGTNQQVHNEACQVLYGGNTFVIDTAFVHSESTLEIDSHFYPGFPNQNGSPVTALQNDRRVQKMLGKGRHNEFARHDPLLVFLRRIGPYCASLIRSIKVNGQFKTAVSISLADVSWADLKRYHEKLPFTDILKIYTHVLGVSCINLRTLTLDRSVGGKFDYSMPWIWAGDDERPEGERISEIVEMFVKRLPTLQRLQLGNFTRSWEDVEDTEEDAHEDSEESSEDVSNDPWREAVKWSTFVKDREVERLFGRGSKTNASEKSNRQVPQDRVFTLPPAIVLEDIQEALPSVQVQLSQQAITRLGQNPLIRVKQFPKPSNKTSEPEKQHKIPGQNVNNNQKSKKNRMQAPAKVHSASQNPFALLMADDNQEDNED